MSCITSFARARATALALLITVEAAAQDPPPRDPRATQPERPTVATHAGTVARGYLEIEAGLELDRGPHDASNHLTVMVAKLGLASRAQLEFLLNGSTPDGGRTGFGDLGLALKLRLLDHHPILGDLALQPAIKSPTGSVARGTGTGTTDGSLLVISSRDAGPIHIDLNLGYTFRGGSGVHAPRDQWLWTASFGGMLGGPLGWTAELFGTPRTSGPSGSPAMAGFLFGPSITARNWLVFDAGAVVPVAGNQPRAYYVGATVNVGRLY